MKAAMPAQDHTAALPARKARLALVNPNTSVSTTEMMVEIAKLIAGPHVVVEGYTASFGSPLITCEEELAVAARAVVALVESGCLHDADGVIISAYGDPGIEELRSRLDIPVIGLAEASLLEAASLEGAFSIATTTPRLIPAMRRHAERCGVSGQLKSIRSTGGDAAEVTSDAAGLPHALAEVVAAIAQADGVGVVIIGGGPLAGAARKLAADRNLQIIEPIPAAIRYVLKQLAEVSR
jgi:allantoin racemase